LFSDLSESSEIVLLHYRTALVKEKTMFKREISGVEVSYRVLYGLWRHVIEEVGEGVRQQIRILARTPATTIDRFFVNSLGSCKQIAGQHVEQVTTTSFPIHHSHLTPKFYVT
jgi:hypothetical protein